MGCGIKIGKGIYFLGINLIFFIKLITQWKNLSNICTGEPAFRCAAGRFIRRTYY